MTTPSTEIFAVDVQSETFTTVTLTVNGRLDAARCPELRELTERHTVKGLRRLTIDLRNTPFIDSVGLAALVKAMRDSESVDGRFEIIKPTNPDAMRIFRLSKFDEVFTMRDAS